MSFYFVMPFLTQLFQYSSTFLAFGQQQLHQKWIFSIYQNAVGKFMDFVSLTQQITTAWSHQPIQSSFYPRETFKKKGKSRRLALVERKHFYPDKINNDDFRFFFPFYNWDSNSQWAKAIFLYNKKKKGGGIEDKVTNYQLWSYYETIFWYIKIMTIIFLLSSFQ